MTTVYKMHKFFDDELNSDLKEVMITRDKLGRLTVYGEYTIIPDSNGYVKVLGKSLSLEFTFLKNALAYVTLIHAGKRNEANRIYQLDLRLCSINVDLAVHRNILKKRSDPDSKLLYMIKVQEDTAKKRKIVEEIKSHINSSIRIFNRKR